MAISVGVAVLAAALFGLIGDYMLHNDNKQFNSSEAEKSREFNREEAEKLREFNHEEAEITRLFNSAEAQKNRDWQKMMSDTSYQRAVNDLKAAGLNPVLAMNSGAAIGSGSSASSTPAISTFGGSSAQATSSPLSISNAVNGAMNSAFKLSLESNPQNTYQREYQNGKLVRVVATEKGRG